MAQLTQSKATAPGAFLITQVPFGCLSTYESKQLLPVVLIFAFFCRPPSYAPPALAVFIKIPYLVTVTTHAAATGLGRIDG
jgi:hypothetical protein